VRSWLLLIRTVVGALFALVGLVDAGAFSWQFFTTKKSDIQNNPTPAQQTAGAAGDIAGGAGSAVQGAGGLARGIGENPLIFLLGGLALVMLAGRR